MRCNVIEMKLVHQTRWKWCCQREGIESLGHSGDASFRKSAQSTHLFRGSHHINGEKGNVANLTPKQGNSGKNILSLLLAQLFREFTM